MPIGPFAACVDRAVSGQPGGEVHLACTVRKTWTPPARYTSTGVDNLPERRCAFRSQHDRPVPPRRLFQFRSSTSTSIRGTHGAVTALG